MDAALVLYRRPNEEVEPVRIAAVSCLIDLDETAEGVAAQVLKSNIFNCVVTGAGLRQPPSQLLLFEKIINLVHTLAPTAKMCFNTTPTDTLEAVQRWIRAT
jgi:formylmethanofuran dehydrogenase subunit B